MEITFFSTLCMFSFSFHIEKVAITFAFTFSKKKKNFFRFKKSGKKFILKNVVVYV